MPTGMPISRQWIFILKDGTPIVEWEDGLVQDLLTGKFVHSAQGDYSHPIRDDELEMLRRAGRVDSFDARQVYVYSLPEPPRRMLD
jgi:hypothetical protein